MLGTKSRYAVTAMLDLALKKGEDPVCISDIAVRQELPENYLEQLFSKLRRAGLVESTRGKKGGYRLSREPEAISVSEVILAVDASLKATACSSRRGCRHKGVTCLSHDLWEGLERHVESYLSAFSLKDVIKGKTDAINLFRGDLSHG
tara:strand:+ start:1124 stop:1567 length:444 start_codon:yes stop_codon:yes gene_type:complete